MACTDITIRPWGYYELVFLNEECSFWHKRIHVNSFEKLSLQFHNFRDEYWFIEEGVGTVQIGENTYNAGKGSSFFVPKGELHRIVNTQSTPLVFTEFAFGRVFEDDIIRVQDEYGRA